MASIRGAKNALSAVARMRGLIDAHGEWLYARNDGGITINLRRGDIDLRVERGRVIFSCWNDTGVHAWRVSEWAWADNRLSIIATKSEEETPSTIELIPRRSVLDAMALITATRRVRCVELAELMRSRWPGAKILRATLSAGIRRGQPGRDARILIRRRNSIVAVTGSVADDRREDLDIFISAVLLWFGRISNRTRPPFVRQLCLIASPRHVRPLAERVTLLRDELQALTSIYVLDDDGKSLSPFPRTQRNDLWSKKPTRLRVPSTIDSSDDTAAIVSFAPDAIDVVFARHGETFRFHGLPFARRRSVMGKVNVWFGVASENRVLLTPENEADFIALIEELREHRRDSPCDRRHTYYRAAPEAWLESILRRDVTRLDPGMIIAPLHAQFRTSQPAAAGARPIDLLGLRTDGRLVVIELKVSEAREHVLQGADYWRRVEAHRRCGNISRARLFGDATIEDAPPLVYLAAPTLRFHSSFRKLAGAISPDIAIYRFDLNEDWRAGVRVMRRMRAN